MQRALVIIDPEQDNRGVFKRACFLAEKADTHVEFFHCLNTPGIHNTGLVQAAEITEKIRSMEEAKLAELAEPFTNYGYDFHIEVVFHKSIIQGILEKIEQFNPDLVIKASHYQASLKRSLFSHLDWQLIRQCPKPLLLNKLHLWPINPNIVIAVDPTHEHDKPEELDAVLLQQGKYWSHLTDGQLQLVHASNISPEIEPLISKQIAEQRQELLEQFAAKYDLPLSETKMLSGKVEDVLPKYTATSLTQLVVMGVLSRSFLDRILIGNTAEKVLDKLNCDILVVKPESQTLTKKALEIGTLFENEELT